MCAGCLAQGSGAAAAGSKGPGATRLGETGAVEGKAGNKRAGLVFRADGGSKNGWACSCTAGGSRLVRWGALEPAAAQRGLRINGRVLSCRHVQLGLPCTLKARRRRGWGARHAGKGVLFR